MAARVPESSYCHKGSYVVPKTLRHHFLLYTGKMTRSKDEHRCKYVLFPVKVRTRIVSGVRLLEFKPQLCYLPAVWPWAGYLLSLCFSFPL